ncbi:peptide-methionine (S)-S-oxide reductase MsrA [Neptunomonas phycophila]|jgi:peptide-methionine (S)-S-oxide reductase|uniref:Peptide methionine sulfoxide reductase MsrA n=1 Tax=Neptunomonas phycophila TaxID=1572645 RepID=A0AAW7XJQ6_9GAMM|nr:MULTISPECIES: peptide-methionine (S)-S-oxide reductase MsrA [Neptunomonas]MDN2658926.1 peptide-methionine (S)-S-oxide reductase MsrA [Neptunomonas sp. CHC150]MDO6454544.1 peptide-methionine (S)-S-oxide reductase MsrA [Neptunomonas phycophila]MDO6468880.1 peptide-methionine (S)-S-oxide reductase MsrA [Neptunomonas phycophila]MDO6782884.1 peptide-methionine (S)-S-oxide reductase MsrA [Neptunomonas phycophila]MDP2522801.1 peptide-methionine (S)-S-oxide reductase MsrA [Neptunomonas phycophila]
MNKMKTLLGSAIGSLILTSALSSQAATQTMIVAGGCFWCVESDFEKIDGVIDVVSGYTGGHQENPTYKQVSSGKTGHYEAVEITFDDEKVSLETLANYYWKTIDPTDDKGQFCDKGTPYLTAMFYQNDEQKAVFEASLKNVEQTKPFDATIVTPILAASTFYLAEDYHQSYYTKNPIRYNYYRSSCGRDNRIEELWGEVVTKKH